MSKLAEKLVKIQTELKAPKNLYNSFGKYKYRNAEGICEAVKPFLKENGCVLLLADEIVAIGERIYVKATAQIIDSETEDSYKVSAFAREPETKKGMDDSQITGTASSYSRKYALNGLFLLDDTKDADCNENHIESEERAKKADKKAESAEAPKAQSTPLQAKQKILYDKCKTDNIDIKKLCMLYKKKNIVDLSETHLDNALAHWDGVVKMCKKVE